MNMKRPMAPSNSRSKAQQKAPLWEGGGAAEPEIICLGGGISNAEDDLLLDPLRELVNRGCFDKTNHTRIEKASLAAAQDAVGLDNHVADLHAGVGKAGEQLAAADQATR